TERQSAAAGRAERNKKRFAPLSVSVIDNRNGDRFAGFVSGKLQRAHRSQIVTSRRSLAGAGSAAGCRSSRIAGRVVNTRRKRCVSGPGYDYGRIDVAFTDRVTGRTELHRRWARCDQGNLPDAAAMSAGAQNPVRVLKREIKDRGARQTG